MARNNKTTYQNFKCKRCGSCCTGEGFVNLEQGESRRIAEFLGISIDEFHAKYTRHDSGYQRYLIDGEGDDIPCIFLKRDEKGRAFCEIEGYAKPEQCKNFPMTWRVPGFEKWCAAFTEEDDD